MPCIQEVPPYPPYPVQTYSPHIHGIFFAYVQLFLTDRSLFRVSCTYESFPLAYDEHIHCISIRYLLLLVTLLATIGNTVVTYACDVLYGLVSDIVSAHSCFLLYVIDIPLGYNAYSKTVLDNSRCRCILITSRGNTALQHIRVILWNSQANI